MLLDPKQHDKNVTVQLCYLTTGVTKCFTVHVYIPVLFGYMWDASGNPSTSTVAYNYEEANIFCSQMSRASGRSLPKLKIYLTKKSGDLLRSPEADSDIRRNFPVLS